MWTCDTKHELLVLCPLEGNRSYRYEMWDEFYGFIFSTTTRHFLPYNVLSTHGDWWRTKYETHCSNSFKRNKKTKETLESGAHGTYKTREWFLKVSWFFFMAISFFFLICFILEPYKISVMKTFCQNVWRLKLIFNVLKQISLIIAIKNTIETENLFLSYIVFPFLMIWEHRVETIVLTIKIYLNFNGYIFSAHKLNCDSLKPL